MSLATRKIDAAVVAGLVAFGLAACEPPPPRLQLTVTSAVAGADDDPGDGVCSSAAAGGACTLRAALEEGNVAPDGADIAVAAGTYRNLTTTITGDVSIDTVSAAAVAITDTTFTVAVGGRLALTGINTSTSISAVPPSLPANPSTSVALVRLDVAGSALVAGSILGDLDIAAGGGAVLVDSVVSTVGVANAGSLLALRSSLFADSVNGPAATVLAAGPGATSHLIGSAIAVPHATVSPFNIDFPGGQGTCSGPAPTSGSFLFVEDPCGPMSGTGDGSGDAGATNVVTFTFTGVGYRQVGSVHGLQPTSPLVDAIPLGDPACPDGAVDVYGNPRGVDGDGDGTGGCDIGAVELQP